MITGNVRRAYAALAAAVKRYAIDVLVGLQQRNAARRGTACDGQPLTPVLGMVVAFRPGAEADLADVPARVVAIWPRLRSGAYLVTLEYAQPIAHHHAVIQQLEAFMSELYQPTGREY